MTLAIGKTGFGLCAVASAWGGDGAPEIRAEFLVDSKNSKQHYAELSKDPQQIQAVNSVAGCCGTPRTACGRARWTSGDPRTGKRPAFRKTATDWLVEKLDRLHKLCSSPASSGSRNVAGASRRRTVIRSSTAPGCRVRLRRNLWCSGSRGDLRCAKGDQADRVRSAPFQDHSPFADDAGRRGHPPRARATSRTHPPCSARGVRPDSG